MQRAAGWECWGKPSSELQLMKKSGATLHVAPLSFFGYLRDFNGALEPVNGYETDRLRIFGGDVVLQLYDYLFGLGLRSTSLTRHGFAMPRIC
jgi:hypothetical protein